MTTPGTKVLFLDRDGTILVEPLPTRQIDAYEKVRFLPGAIGALARLARSGAWELVLVTNQDGLGTDSFPEDTFWPAHRLMLEVLEGEGVRFAREHVDRSFAHEGLPTRKPGTGMLGRYLDPANGYDLAGSYVVGDRVTDVELAANLGANAVLYGGLADDRAALVTSSWDELATFLASRGGPNRRRAAVRRATTETDVQVEVDLDGAGRAEVSTGLGFFDHMLEQLAKHGALDLVVRVKGDLRVDEHHTVEDTALALGEAVSKALGERRGIERYGFLLPMDEALARAAVDFSGRPQLVFRADFRREKVGDLPTELVPHFFKSFCDTARCNLNVACDGDNAHHQIESIFKAVARAIRAAVRVDAAAGPLAVPSTKGTLT